jgi:hypothetical protein
MPGRAGSGQACKGWRMDKGVKLVNRCFKQTHILGWLLMQVLITDHVLIFTLVDAERKVGRQQQILDRQNIGNYSIISAFDKRAAIQQPSNCNITKECHICPEDAVRDDAEYCIKTGWRQVVSGHPCINSEYGSNVYVLLTDAYLY